MADTYNISGPLFRDSAILFIIGFEIHLVGGASRYSGSRYSGSRYSGSRYSGRSYTGYTRYSSSRASGLQWKVGLLSSVYYGSRRYMTRQRYYSDQAPQICENYENLNENGTGYWGQFVCPLGELPDDYEYCCGEYEKQMCCTFFDDPGRTAGVVIGVLLLFVLVGVVIFVCCRWQKKKNKLKNNSARSNSRQSNRVEPLEQRISVLSVASSYPSARSTAWNVTRPNDAVSPPSYEEVQAMSFLTNTQASGHPRIY